MNKKALDIDWKKGLKYAGKALEYTNPVYSLAAKTKDLMGLLPKPNRNATYDHNGNKNDTAVDLTGYQTAGNPSNYYIGKAQESVQKASDINPDRNTAKSSLYGIVNGLSPIEMLPDYSGSNYGAYNLGWTAGTAASATGGAAALKALKNSGKLGKMLGSAKHAKNRYISKGIAKAQKANAFESYQKARAAIDPQYARKLEAYNKARALAKHTGEIYATEAALLGLTRTLTGNEIVDQFNGWDKKLPGFFLNTSNVLIPYYKEGHYPDWYNYTKEKYPLLFQKNYNKDYKPNITRLINGKPNPDYDQNKKTAIQRLLKYNAFDPETKARLDSFIKDKALTQAIDRLSEDKNIIDLVLPQLELKEFGQPPKDVYKSIIRDRISNPKLIPSKYVKDIAQVLKTLNDFKTNQIKSINTPTFVANQAFLYLSPYYDKDPNRYWSEAQKYHVNANIINDRMQHTPVDAQNDILYQYQRSLYKPDNNVHNNAVGLLNGIGSALPLTLMLLRGGASQKHFINFSNKGNLLGQSANLVGNTFLNTTPAALYAFNHDKQTRSILDNPLYQNAKRRYQNANNKVSQLVNKGISKDDKEYIEALKEQVAATDAFIPIKNRYLGRVAHLNQKFTGLAHVLSMISSKNPLGANHMSMVPVPTAVKTPGVQPNSILQPYSDNILNSSPGKQHGWLYATNAITPFSVDAVWNAATLASTLIAQYKANTAKNAKDRLRYQYMADSIPMVSTVPYQPWGNGINAAKEYVAKNLIFKLIMDSLNSGLPQKLKE